MFAALVHWCKMAGSTNVLMNYRENWNVRSTLPICLDREQNIKICSFKMATK
jgi:hypothetical protein